MLPLVSHGANLFNQCPFPESPALYVQNVFPIGTAVWPHFPGFWIVDPLKPPKMSPLGIIIIIIIRQPLCPVVGRRPQHVVSKWPCLVLSSAISCCSSICPGRLSTAWLVSLDVFSCHMVSKWWRARSIGRLWGGWYALPRTISFFSQCRLYLWVLSSP